MGISVSDQDLKEFMKGCQDPNIFSNAGHKYGAQAFAPYLAQEVGAETYYNSLIDKVFVRRTVKPGEVVRYDKDPHIVGYSVNKYGVPICHTNTYIYPSDFEVFCEFSVRDPGTALDALTWKNDLVQAAAYDIVKSQDQKFIDLIRYITRRNSRIPSGKTIEATFDRLIKSIEKRKIPAGALLVSRVVADFIYSSVAAVTAAGKAPAIDVPGNTEIFKCGSVGTYKGLNIIQPSAYLNFPALSDFEVFAFSEPPYLGGASDRARLLCEPMAFPDMYIYKLMYEVIVNPFALCSGSFDKNLALRDDGNTTVFKGCSFGAPFKHTGTTSGRLSSEHPNKAASPKSVGVPASNLYCTCSNKSIMIVPIGGTPVNVCTKCKKEVK